VAPAATTRSTTQILAKAAGIIALATFFASWFGPWVRSIPLPTSSGFTYYLFPRPYADPTGPIALWIALTAIFLVAVFAPWLGSKAAVVIGVLASIAVVGLIVGSMGRIGPNAHLALPSDLAKAFAHTSYYWSPSLQPWGYIAISSSLLLGLSSLLWIIDRPWASLNRDPENSAPSHTEPLT